MTTSEDSRPPIFDERNRPFWDAARRFMIYLLRELDKWYGWETFNRKPHQWPPQE